MKNILTGWVTTLIGLALMVLSILHFYGFVYLPAPVGISAEWQLTVGFVVGLVLFLLPRGKIEETLIKLISDKTEK